MVRAKKMLGVSCGKRKEDKQWDEEVQEQRKMLANKRWDSQGDEENRQEYWETRCMAKRDFKRKWLQ